jgi:hypothetical protein
VNRLGPEQGQDLVGVAVTGEAVDQTPGISLGASCQVVRKDMEDQ